jgi:drug/metabolite transporter (DMT)-like permease
MSLACSVVLLAAALVSRAPLLPGDGTQALCVLAIALGPHLVGNSILGWALGWLPAPKVALVILGEPVGASLIAFVAFDQRPGMLALAGGLLVLVAVWEGARGSPKGAPAPVVAD